jgi:hypothetical protein
LAHGLLKVGKLFIDDANGLAKALKLGFNLIGFEPEAGKIETGRGKYPCPAHRQPIANTNARKHPGHL